MTRFPLCVLALAQLGFSAEPAAVQPKAAAQD